MATLPKTLVIPPEMRQEINVYSGYLGMKSRYCDWNLKKLFHCPENVNYITKQVWSLITSPDYIQRHLADDDADPSTRPVDRIAQRGTSTKLSGQGGSTGFGNRVGSLRGDQVRNLLNAFRNPQTRRLLVQVVPRWVEDHRMSPPEDMQIANPVIQLHLENLDFIVTSARNIILSPDSVCSHYFKINPDTGQVDTRTQYEATDSYADGTWHPEHLFVQRTQTYWTPLEVNFESSSTAGGPGHRYNRAVYHGDKLTARSRANPGSRVNISSPAGAEQFPRWQYSVNDRPIERDYVYNSQTLNGEQDRRTNFSRGYDLSALVKRSTY
jgi:hypothetical protein